VLDLTLMAAFLSPEPIGVEPASILWLLPLALSTAVVYKATKAREITASFIRESLVLFGSIVLFMAAAAAVLFVVAFLVSG
jgi:hypothetical protein